MNRLCKYNLNCICLAFHFHRLYTCRNPGHPMLSLSLHVANSNILCSNTNVLYSSLVTNQNSFQEEIKFRLNAGNSCYYSVRTLWSSRLLTKNLKIKIYKIIILPVVLYGCETWSLALREECRLRVFENRILRRIFWPKRDENGEWRRLNNEELHSLYSSPNILRVMKSRRLRWAGYVGRLKGRRTAFKILAVTHTVKRPLGRPRRR